jgi:hypothetical protein
VQATEENRDLVALGSSERQRLVGTEVLSSGALHSLSSSQNPNCPSAVQTAV